MSKYLVLVIGGLFLVLLFASLYISGTHYEGLVEEGYSERAEQYFQTLRQEDSLGLRIRVTQTLDPFMVEITTKKGPLVGAQVLLRVGRIDSPKDLVFKLQQTSPGMYTTVVRLPRPGYYMFNLEVSSSEIKTSRRWFRRVETEN